ncbi:MAG: Crp/Fnr family transcriptional regulator [Dissulfurispiraceae bacterium]|jgi:CRP/FNR family transcriptional regulator|nr:Crp/Fnr family transcriptional regulator [Dissulfurispiraceae bacterium]
MMKTILENLSLIPIFSSLSDSELADVKPFCEARHIRKKELVFSEGSEPDWFYICLSGKVKITKTSHDGKEIIIEVISPLDFFGGFAVIRGFPYPASAYAMEDASILRIKREKLDLIIDKHPQVMHAITSNLGMRVRDFHANLKSIALDKVESRIASILCKLAEKSGVFDGSGVTIDMRLTKQDIAEMAGTTVETAIRVAGQFKKAGIIMEQDGRTTIIDMDRLKEKFIPKQL